jgi:methylated-DNA-[protein]-cysteine S-methyltransferase
MTKAHYSSPIGLLEIQSVDSSITSIKFIDHNDMLFSIPEPGSILDQCFLQLDEYFNGSRKDFTFSINQLGTDFQKKVWNQLLTIPYGNTVSYAELSLQLGDIKKIRAVGTTNGKNNLAIVVPCHRVIGSNRQLIGYAGGLWRKRWLLEHEAKFTPGVRQLTLV